MTPHRIRRSAAAWLQLALLLLLLPTCTSAGELARWTEPQMTPNVNHRQNVCARNEQYLNGSLPLEKALKGMEINVLLAARDYFFYDPETGMDEENPGMMAVILDEIARRGEFTWRNSFGVSYLPTNETWTELLVWGIDSYDVVADWWALNLERLQLGVHFLEPWYDSSLLLMTKDKPEETVDEINMTNWMRPYEPEVWALTIFTIILSGLVYQWIEWLQDERDGRSLWDWWQENWYLSCLNFTQAYEYQPKSLAGRLFGVSMAIWALVMTATYTANLASLLVDRKPVGVVVESVDQVAVYGFRICVWKGTWSDVLIKTNYPTATRIQKDTEAELYQGLHNGECEYAATAKASFAKHRHMKAHNTYCDLQWVGEPLYLISSAQAGFVTKVDSGPDYCSGLISSVFDLHMKTMRLEGVLDDMWTIENERSKDIDCNTYDPSAFVETEDSTTSAETDPDDGDARTRMRRRLKESQQLHNRRHIKPPPRQTTHNHHRILKAGGKGAVGGAVAAKGDATSESQQLTLEQMIGTFVFHWGVMAVSLMIAYWNTYYNKHLKRPVGKAFSKAGQSLREFRGDTKLTGEESNNEDSSSRPSEGDHRRSFATADTIKWYNEPPEERGDQQEAAPAKSIAQELAEMRAFQMQILEEQRAMQRQMQLLADAATSAGMGDESLKSIGDMTI